MITPIYAAVLSLLYVGLSVRTLLLRRKLKIGIGTGDSESMLRAVRAHSNFAEYAPIALLLAFMIETLQGHSLILNFVCACLLFGRIIHCIGVSRVNENYNYRVIGMALTFTSICTSALVLLYETILTSA